jgi:tRNA-splicing ligase RtcB
MGIAHLFGTHDDATRDQLANVARHVRSVAFMADGPVGSVMPIGGVAAHEDAVSVVGVGFHIACGNATIRTDRTLDELGGDERRIQRPLERIGDEIQWSVSFGVGRKNDAGADEFDPYKD